MNKLMIIFIINHCNNTTDLLFKLHLFIQKREFISENIIKLTFYIRGRNDQGLGAKRPGPILEAKRPGAKRLGGKWFGGETSCYHTCGQRL